MIFPAKRPRRVLKKSDPTFEQASKELKGKILELYKDFGADPLNKKILKDIQKNVGKYVNAIAPYDLAMYTLLESQWLRLIETYKEYLSDPKNATYSKNVSDAFLVFKTETEKL